MQPDDIQHIAREWDNLGLAVGGFGFAAIFAYATVEFCFGPAAVRGLIRRAAMALGIAATTGSLILPFVLAA